MEINQTILHRILLEEGEKIVHEVLEDRDDPILLITPDIEGRHRDIMYFLSADQESRVLNSDDQLSGTRLVLYVRSDDLNLDMREADRGWYPDIFELRLVSTQTGTVVRPDGFNKNNKISVAGKQYKELRDIAGILIQSLPRDMREKVEGIFKHKINNIELNLP